MVSKTMLLAGGASAVDPEWSVVADFAMVLVTVLYLFATVGLLQIALSQRRDQVAANVLVRPVWDRHGTYVLAEVVNAGPGHARNLTVEAVYVEKDGSDGVASKFTETALLAGETRLLNDGGGKNDRRALRYQLRWSDSSSRKPRESSGIVDLAAFRESTSGAIGSRLDPVDRAAERIDDFLELHSGRLASLLMRNSYWVASGGYQDVRKSNAHILAWGFIERYLTLLAVFKELAKELVNRLRSLRRP